MKRLFFLLAVASMAVLSSCNKCKDDPCKNGADCDKKSGDCTCATYYEGSSCDSEVRSKFAGTYNGGIDIPSFPTMPSTVVISNGGTAPTGQDFKITVITDVSGSTAQINVSGNLTSNTTVEIPATQIAISILPHPNDTTATVSGTGTYYGDSLAATMNITGDFTGFTVPATLSAKK